MQSRTHHRCLCALNQFDDYAEALPLYQSYHSRLEGDKIQVPWQGPPFLHSLLLPSRTKFQPCCAKKIIHGSWYNAQAADSVSSCVAEATAH